MSDLKDRLAAALGGRYRIERELGHGGMAIVFLAHDEKHNRAVAIKVLRPELAAIIGAERFLAEIETTAQLQHPHILPLYDSGEADTFLYYVMPYVEGESLEDRMERERQLPVDEAVRIASEVADALHHAHERGVIHRDVKPANVLLQEGRAMVADFGISLAVREAGSERMTETGLSLGTPNYMSPEQATADRDVDARSDVYSLGAMVYEMLAGRPPHAGASLQSVIASVLTKEPPPVDEDRSSIPPALAAVVHRAIARLPADRYQSAADFRRELMSPPPSVARGAAEAGVSGDRVSRGMLVGVVAAAALAGVAIGGALLGGSRGGGSGAEAVPVRFTIEVPAKGEVGPSSTIAISRDGATIAYTALDSATGGVGIRLRPLNGLAERGLELGGNAQSPSFDPTGRYLAYEDDFINWLYDLELDRRVQIGERSAARPGAWAEDGGYYFSLVNEIVRATPGGSDPEVLYRFEDDLSRPEALPLYVFKFPGRDALAYAAYDRDRLDAPSVWTLDLGSGERKQIVETGTAPMYLPFGALVWQGEAGELLAAPFDLDALEFTGEPVPVATGVEWSSDGQALYSFSDNGVLVYQSGSGDDRLVEVSLDGSVRPIANALPGDLDDVELSPGGDRLAVQALALNGAQEIWILDFDQGTQARLTVGGGENWRPIWHPDGTRVAFVSDRGGIRSIWERRADASEPARELVRRERLVQQITWLSDTDYVFREGFDDGTTLRDLFTGSTDGTDPTPFVSTPFDELAPDASPDGRWVAYVSDESGDDEVYVSPWPGPGGRVAISATGGTEPAWSPDGSTLYYRSNADSLMAASLTFEGGDVRVLGREALFPAFGFLSDNTDRAYTVRPDGTGFVMIQTPPTREFVVVSDWFTEVRAALGMD